MTRRTLMGAMALAPLAATAARKEWKPQLGILGNYTVGNVEFAHSLGYTNMILGVGPGAPLDAVKVAPPVASDRIPYGNRRHLRWRSMRA